MEEGRTQYVENNCESALQIRSFVYFIRCKRCRRDICLVVSRVAGRWHVPFVPVPGASSYVHCVYSDRELVTVNVQKRLPELHNTV